MTKRFIIIFMSFSLLAACQTTKSNVGVSSEQSNRGTVFAPHNPSTDFVYCCGEAGHQMALRINGAMEALARIHPDQEDKKITVWPQNEGSCPDLNGVAQRFAQDFRNIYKIENVYSNELLFLCGKSSKFLYVYAYPIRTYDQKKNQCIVFKGLIYRFSSQDEVLSISPTHF